MSVHFPLQQPAQVIIAHGRLLRVRGPDGSEALARAAHRDLQIVCGDYVRCEHDARHDELRVVALEPRSSALYRSNARGGAELIAANLSLLVVVAAPLPVADFYITDRYLAAADSAAIGACVVFNKIELGVDDAGAAELDAYARIGYPCLRVSATTPLGLEPLRGLLRGQTAVLVGQSGVGKSSLLQALVPGGAPAIGALLRDDEGRHTTSATRLYALKEGGALIDSPGVRDFAPALQRLHSPALGFREIAALAAGCRFADCAHLREPDCAVRAALGAAVSPRRYESYRRLHRLRERLGALSPSPARRPRR